MVMNDNFTKHVIRTKQGEIEFFRYKNLYNIRTSG